MSFPASQSEIEAFVRQWQAPVYNLAHRMLRDPGGADDLTCDIMRRALERLGQVDPKRGHKQWMYRLATNAILNHLRAAKTRRAREAEGASSALDAEDVMERKAAELAVQAGVRTLPDDARTLVVLHFYSGLSKSEIADVLDVPRTTVQSRMATALHALRKQLSGAGFAGLTPMLESTLASTRGEAVPLHLQKSLEHLIGASSTASVAAATATAGGLIVTKKLICVGAALLLLGGAGGYWTRGLADESSSATRDRRTALLGTAEESPIGTNSPALVPTDLAKGDGEDQALAAATTQASETPEGKRATKLDWTRFRELLGANRGLFARLRAMESGDVTKEQRAIAFAVTAEFMRLAGLAHGVSASPSTDAEVFPDFTVAYFDSILKPGKAARDALRSRASLELANAFASVDRSRTLPVRMRVIREQAKDRIIAWIKEEAGEDRAEDLDELLALTPVFMDGGNYNLLGVGVGVSPPEGERSAVESIVHAWREGFGLTENQMSIARVAAERIVEGAKDELRNRSLNHKDAHVSTQEIVAELKRAYRRLQVESEDQLTRLLTAEQFAAAREHGPTVMWFYWGSGEEISMEMGGL